MNQHIKVNETSSKGYAKKLQDKMHRKHAEATKVEHYAENKTPRITRNMVGYDLTFLHKFFKKKVKLTDAENSMLDDIVLRCGHLVENKELTASQALACVEEAFESVTKRPVE